LAIDPKDTATLSSKGNALNEIGNHSGAISYYDRSLVINCHSGAISYYDRSLVINPKYESALYNKGVALDDLGNYTRAIKYYDKALAIDPNDTYALDNKGLALDNLGNDTEAILYFDKALAIQPNDTYALDHKAAALGNLGNHTGAILYYNKALTIDPKNTFALTNKDAILHMLGNNSTYSTYVNSTYGIHAEYPSDWTIQESNATGTLIRIATFVSPTGPDSNPTADISIYLDKLHNSTTTLNNYAHFVAFTDYENRPSYFHAFKLLELRIKYKFLDPCREICIHDDWYI
jgi:tetratricopeptide (TPR) repeat protein